MSYLHDKLNALYAERADYQERMQRLKDDPELAEKIRESVRESRGRGERSSEAMAGILAASMSSIAIKDGLEREIKWIEAQILAILRNPALGNE